jgi:hypothetical protein
MSFYDLDDVNALLSGYRIGALVPQFAAFRPPGYPSPMAAGPGFGRPAFYNPLAPTPGLPGFGASPIPVGQSVLNQTAPTKDGQLALPMSSSGVVTHATSATITGRPQIPAFRPERIVVANSIATAFTISDIKVGNTSQLVQAGTLPAEAFIQGAFGVEMRMDTVQTAMDFVIQVNNIDATTDHQFLCMVFGRSVY